MKKVASGKAGTSRARNSNKSNVKKPQNVLSMAKKQAGLTEVAMRAFTKLDNSIHGIWLVRQGLRSRSEQYIAIAKNRKDAIEFCRNFLTPKYCRENEKSSLGLVNDGGDKINRVTYSTNTLLIKGVDFTRKDPGRTNQNPLWYWVIAPAPIVEMSKIKSQRGAE